MATAGYRAMICQEQPGLHAERFRTDGPRATQLLVAVTVRRFHTVSVDSGRSEPVNVCTSQAKNFATTEHQEKIGAFPESGPWAAGRSPPSGTCSRIGVRLCLRQSSATWVSCASTSCLCSQSNICTAADCPWLRGRTKRDVQKFSNMTLYLWARWHSSRSHGNCRPWD